MHPLQENISNLTDDELYNKMSDINKRISQAYRMNMQDAVSQLQLLMQGYQYEYSERQRKKLEEYDKQYEKQIGKYGDSIDIQ